MIDILSEIEEQLKTVTAGSKDQIDLLINYSWELGYAEVKKSIEISEEALALAEKIGYKKGIAFAKGNIGIFPLGNPGSDIEKSKTYIFLRRQTKPENLTIRSGRVGL